MKIINYKTMPRAKRVEEVKEGEEAKLEPVLFQVFVDGAFVREYSVEVHGEKAGELAQEFANKVNGQVK